MNKKFLGYTLIITLIPTIVSADLLSLTNKTGLPLWLKYEASNACTQTNDFFSQSGKKIEINQTESLSLDKNCTPRSLHIFTQDPTTTPGKPTVVSLYGQLVSRETNHSFTIERTVQGRFILKRAR